jgi:hypothetical protein
MTRTNFLGPLSALIVVGFSAACNGHVVSLGDTGDTQQPVSTAKATAEASGTTPSGASGAISCATGWAHPNVCCSSGPDLATTCGAWEDNPFRSCDGNSTTTYPDLLDCCELANPANCTNTPPSTGPVPPPTPPPVYGCGYACPPGWWSQPPGEITPGGGVEGPMCCTSYGAGGTECVSQGSGTIPVSVGVSCVNSTSPGYPPGYPNGTDAAVPVPATDAGPVLVDDGGYPVLEDGGEPIYDDASIEDAGTTWPDDAGCSYPEDAGPSFPPGYDGGVASLCPVCPPGWNQDQIQPELCCQTLPGGLTLCFSQAFGSATVVNGSEPEPEDAAVLSTPSNPGSSSGGSNQSGGSSSPGSSSSGG